MSTEPEDVDVSVPGEGERFHDVMKSYRGGSCALYRTRNKKKKKMFSMFDWMLGKTMIQDTTVIKTEASPASCLHLTVFRICLIIQLKFVTRINYILYADLPVTDEWK